MQYHGYDVKTPWFTEDRDFSCLAHRFKLSNDDIVFVCFSKNHETLYPWRIFTPRMTVDFLVHARKSDGRVTFFIKCHPSGFISGLYLDSQNEAEVEGVVSAKKYLDKIKVKN